MKKIIAILSVILVLLALGACAVKSDSGFKVGLVTDVGGIDDKSFNQGTWEGVVKYGTENKLTEGKQYKYLQSTAEADYVVNLSTFADEKMSLIIAPGFLFNGAMYEVATKYPKQKFLIIDSVVTTPADKDKDGKDIPGTGGKNLPNVANAVFAEHEGSFLVGVAAGLKAKADGKKVLGFLGGMQFALIEKFEAGFVQGVKAVYPDCKILIDYAGAFDKPDIGQAIAQKQFNAGAYIIFQAAGATGNGMIKEAKERTMKGKAVWAIGVDKDQYADGVYEGEKSVILTSMMKRVDVAAYDVITQTKAGKFPGGQVITYNAANGGVGIPVKNPNLSDEIVAAVKDYEGQIKAGKLVVSETPQK
jgi:basic membrane protein A and related proteins